MRFCVLICVLICKGLRYTELTDRADTIRGKRLSKNNRGSHLKDLPVIVQYDTAPGGLVEPSHFISLIRSHIVIRLS